MINEIDSYQKFLGRIHDFLVYYGTLMYANAFLTEHFIDPEKIKCLDGTDFHFAASDNMDGRFSITSETIKHIILNHRPGESLKDSAQNIMKGNAHFLRTRVINNMFELIKAYLDNKNLMKELHKLDWFQVLYLLRNNSSHLDNHSKEIKFPDWRWLDEPYPSVVSWNDITIKNNQRGETIKYNDKQIINLLDKVNSYFIENESIYSKN